MNSTSEIKFFYSQASSSVTPKIRLMNFIRNMNPLVVVDFKFISVFLHSEVVMKFLINLYNGLYVVWWLRQKGIPLSAKKTAIPVCDIAHFLSFFVCLFVCLFFFLSQIHD